MTVVHILVIEDDPSIGESVSIGLQREGFEVTLAATGAQGLQVEQPEFVLLDLGLPDMEGSAVCRKLRERSSVPIIVVSARSAETERISLLDLGADDYLVKPFSLRELIARIHAVLRRYGPTDERSLDEIHLGELTIDTRTHTATFRQKEVQLTSKEFDLLCKLAEDPGRLVTRDELLHDVWDENWWGSTKTLDVHIASLRKKIAPEYIVTVRGAGYKLAANP